MNARDLGWCAVIAPRQGLTSNGVAVAVDGLLAGGVYVRDPSSPLWRFAAQLTPVGLAALRDNPPPEAPGPGVLRIIRERVRQVHGEGWTAEHDDAEHGYGELARAASCYACGDDEYWPWDAYWWKPAWRIGRVIQTPDDARLRIRDLERAGALIAAEIDRLERLIARAP